MNTDFRLSTSYFTHPKIKRLRRRLGGDGCFAHVGLLSFTALHRPDGRLGGFDAEDIADGAGYTGDAQAFVETLVELRLLDRDADGTLSVHDWAEHNTWAAEAQQRSENARANAQSRWDKERAAKQGQEVKQAPPAQAAKSAQATPPANQPAKSAPPHPLQTAADAAAVPPQMQTGAGADAAAVPPLCSFPVLSSPILPSPSVASPNATTPSVSDARAPVGEHAAPGSDESCRDEVVALLLAQGISEVSARELVGNRSCEAIRQYLDDFPERLEDRRQKGKDTRDPAGLLFRAIQDGWGRPESVKRRVAEAETRRKAEEAARRSAEDAGRREALKRADAERLEAAWSALSQSERDEITEQQSAAMLQVVPWKGQSEKYGEEFWGREQPQSELRKRCRIALIERGLVTQELPK